MIVCILNCQTGFDFKSADFSGDTSAQYKESHKSVIKLLETSSGKWANLARAGPLNTKFPKKYMATLKRISINYLYFFTAKHKSLKIETLKNFYFLSKQKFWSTHLAHQK